MLTNLEEEIPTPQNIYVCEFCKYKTRNRKDFGKHLETKKHKKLTDRDKVPKNDEFNKFQCDCGKTYKYRQSLHHHKKKCFDIETYNDDKENQITNIDENLGYKEMFLTMINENKELRNIVINQQSQLGEQQKQISEMIPKIGSNNNNNNTINNKQKFNINVFLNEQCKDAMTMNTFLDNIKITIEDLMHTKTKGITEGVSNLFIKNMNKLSLYERPIHCTDVKRETLYIKSEGKDGETSEWQKDKEQEKLKRAISDMTFVQSKNLKLYTDENPDWMDKEHKQNEYVMMMKNCMDDIKKDNRREKIVKKVCNNVYYNGGDD